MLSKYPLARNMFPGIDPAVYIITKVYILSNSPKFRHMIYTAISPRKDGNIWKSIMNISMGFRPLKLKRANIKAVNIVISDEKIIVSVAIVKVFLYHKG